MNRRQWQIGSVAVLPLLATACASTGGSGAEAEGDWPQEALTWIVPTAAGGGGDTIARQLQPVLEDELGVPVTIQNREGGNFSVGPTILTQEGNDCDPMMEHFGILFEMSHLTQEVAYDGDDFVEIAGFSAEPAVIRVRNDAPYDTLEEFIEYAKANPGEVKVGASSATDTAYFAMREIANATGAEFNLVPYEGGGPMRTALVAGEIDAIHTWLYTSLGIQDDTKILAVHAEENTVPDLTNNAPTVDEALGMDSTAYTLSYGSYVTRQCFEDYPERYERLQEAFMNALESEEFRSTLEAAGTADMIRPVEGDEWSDEVDRMVEGVMPHLEEMGVLVDGKS